MRSNTQKMKVLCNGRALFANQQSIWMAKGMSYWRCDYEGRLIGNKQYIGSMKDRILACNRLSSQLLRVGIHHMFPLLSGNILISTKKCTYIVNEEGEILNTFRGFRGNKPAQFGICEADNGDIFFGEYTINLSNDHPTSLFCSHDGGESFEKIYEFHKDEIRHIHFIQWDQFEHCLWMGTGDKDHECLLMRSNDYGKSWAKIGGGNQQWRAIGVLFTKDELYWGTDAGSVPDPNFIIKMDRKTCELSVLYEMDGPCHGIASLRDGRMFFCAGVEGGENETDRYVRLYEIKNGTKSEIFKMKKDIFPLILQYGVFHFPHGLEQCDRLIMSSFGVIHGGEKTYIYSE